MIFNRVSSSNTFLSEDKKIGIFFSSITAVAGCSLRYRDFNSIFDIFVSFTSNTISIIDNKFTSFNSGHSHSYPYNDTSNLDDFASRMSGFKDFSTFYDTVNYTKQTSDNGPASVSFPFKFSGDSFNLDDFLSIYVHTVSFLQDDFDTQLYSELLDNSEQFQLAKSFLNDTDPSKELDPTYWTDTQLKFFKFVEEYNKNVISLRASKKVNANVSGSISQSGQSDIDLSPIVQQLSNINNKLQTTEQIDNTQKSITDVLNQQSNTIQVDEIGLLRSKKGYY